MTVRSNIQFIVHDTAIIDANTKITITGLTESERIVIIHHSCHILEDARTALVVGCTEDECDLTVASE